MKIRVKFGKQGAMKFVGHLDTMRYFQKAIRRAGLPAAYSGGFSPHMILSFASPLGVGMTSAGEYFDLELSEEVSPAEAAGKLKEQMAEGFTVYGAVRVSDGKATNAMALVAAADYAVWFREGKIQGRDWEGKIGTFLEQKEIFITKSGKTGERQVDIRPFIYEMRLLPGTSEGLPGLPVSRMASDAVFMRLASASANYTRPDQVIGAFYRYLGIPEPPFPIQVHRIDTYAEGEAGISRFVPLDALGTLL